MKGCIIMVYIQEHHSDNEDIIKYSNSQWRLFLIHKVRISCIIGFYIYKYLSLYNGCLETVHINNQAILHFINLWPKEVVENISYPSNLDQTYGYMDVSMIPTYVSYII